MIISGTITGATPPGPPQGTHNVIYQDITITDQQDQAISGRIGSKQGYAVGTAVQVTVERKSGQNGPYNYFKKYNPQYAQQGQQQGQQGPPRAPQQPNAQKDVDWDAKDLRMARMNGLTNATRLMCLLAEMDKVNTNSDTIKRVAAEYVDFIYHGIRKAPNTASQLDESSQGAKYQGNAWQEPDSEEPPI